MKECLRESVREIVPSIP